MEKIELVPLTEGAQELIEKIKQKEAEITEIEISLASARSQVELFKSKLNIPWQTQVLYCLRSGKGFYALKTPVQVSECVALNFGFEVNRAIKNNISTSLSTMFNDGKIGRVEIGGKRYYGLLQYFNKDKESLKKEYMNLKEGRERNP